MKIIDIQAISRFKFQNPERDLYIYLPREEFFQLLKQVEESMNLKLEDGAKSEDISQVELFGVYVRLQKMQ